MTEREKHERSMARVDFAEAALMALLTLGVVGMVLLAVLQVGIDAQRMGFFK